MAETAPSQEKPTDPIPQKPDPSPPISQPDPFPPNPILPLNQPQPPILQLPPSFRPPAPPVPLSLPPQFLPVPTFQVQNNVVQPPGVPGVPGSIPGGLVFAPLPNQRPPYMQMPNGYLPPPVSSS